MNVCLLALWGDSLAYTIAKALTFIGHQVQVWVADPERHNSAGWGTPQRIAAVPGASVVTDAAAHPQKHVDHLIVQGHPVLLRYASLLDRLAEPSARLTLISAGDRNRPLRQALRLQWRERRWLGRWFGKVQRIAYKDGYYNVDLLGLLRSRRVVGFDPHSKFLQDATLFQAIHATDWDSDVRRLLRANFLGSRDPEIRRQILESVEGWFVPVAAERGEGHRNKRSVWHVYSDAQPAALSPQEFLRVLSDSDFTLAPPGYSLVTHRPLEAMLRGSIPVLNASELDLYDLGLTDGVNCIAVRPGRWPAAMERITAMSEAEVVRMRGNIRSMLADRVSYPALARAMGRRLGLPG